MEMIKTACIFGSITRQELIRAFGEEPHLIENHQFCRDVFDGALGAGNLEVLEWLLAAGVPPTVNATGCAVRGVDTMKSLQWLQSHGWMDAPTAFTHASVVGDQRVVEWLEGLGHVGVPTPKGLGRC
jgi:hypothetical protein